MTFLPTVQDLLDTKHTIAYRMFESVLYPHEVLSKIEGEIVKIGSQLSLHEYNKIGDSIWIARTAVIDDSAEIIPPAIICDGAVLRHGAYIRGNVIIGCGCTIGNASEIKNSIIFDGAQIPHFNYIGDSVMGYKTHVGAGVIASNVRIDKKSVVIHYENAALDTKMKKMGAVIGDFAEVGCNSVLCPGTILGRRSIVYPLSVVRRTVGENMIYKGNGKIVERKNADS